MADRHDDRDLIDVFPEPPPSDVVLELQEVVRSVQRVEDAVGRIGDGLDHLAWAVGIFAVLVLWKFW